MFDSLVWISGMPRSGTNWLAQIFASHPDVRLKTCPLFSYEFKNAMGEESSPEEWGDFFRQVYLTQSEYLDQDYLRRENAVPAFPEREVAPRTLAIKSTRFHHLTPSIIEKVPMIVFVGIVRHPCGAVHSWLTNPLEFPAGCDPLREWRSGACRTTGPEEYWGFDAWKRVASMFLALEMRYPDQFHLVRYETLTAHATAETRRLFSSLGLSWASQTERFLADSQSRHTEHKRGVFKRPDVADRWRSELSPKVAREMIDELVGTPLERFIQPVGA
ncbi:MAG: sulfotransferase [Nitrospinae bacterium]|nr:sulfotransferase [Nitrospinota bacterium]